MKLIILRNGIGQSPLLLENIHAVVVTLETGEEYPVVLASELDDKVFVKMANEENFGACLDASGLTASGSASVSIPTETAAAS
jgi:hypothetical protein